MSDHVVFCRHDGIARTLIRRLTALGLPYVVIEGDPARATELDGDGVSVVCGRADSIQTYEAIRASEARVVIASDSDAVNANITLTVREVAPEVPIVTFAEGADSVDVLELSGASHVLAVKQRLGQQLANRVAVGTQTAYRIGSFEGLSIAEFPDPRDVTARAHDPRYPPSANSRASTSSGSGSAGA